MSQLERYCELLDEYYAIVFSKEGMDRQRALQKPFKEMDGIWDYLTKADQEKAHAHALKLYERRIS